MHGLGVPSPCGSLHRVTQTILPPPVADPQPLAAVSPGPPVAPREPRERLVAIDAIRGLALLGILLVNAAYFAMPTAWADAPLHYGPHTPADLAVWACIDVFATGKFIALFSTLFGAGVWLMTEHAGSRGPLGMSPAALHYRRMGWLLAIGAVHAYLIWSGDVLVTYALCGMLLYPLRGLRVRTQLILALACLVVGTIMLLAWSGLFYAWQALDPQSYAEFEMYPADETEAEIAAYRGGPIAQAMHRVPSTLAYQAIMLVFFLPTYFGLMLLGMVLVRTGILGGARSIRFYGVVLLVGLLVGLSLSYAANAFERSNSDNVGVAFLVYGVNGWVAPLVGYAYAAAVVLLVKSGALRPLTDALAAVGRMALSNYLLQSLLFTAIFYGHGLGLFATLGYADLLPLVAGTWILQLAFSPFWLKRFRFGPAEWLWRRLTYGTPQAMRMRA